jgi:hypothetical protein
MKLMLVLSHTARTSGCYFKRPVADALMQEAKSNTIAQKWCMHLALPRIAGCRGADTAVDVAERRNLGIISQLFSNKQWQTSLYCVIAEYHQEGTSSYSPLDMKAHPNASSYRQICMI